MTDQGLTEYDLCDFLPKEDQNLCENCTLLTTPKALPHIKIVFSRARGMRKNYKIIVSKPDFKGRLVLALGPGTGHVQIDTAGPANLDIRTWRNSTLRVGEGTTVNNAQIVCDNADLSIGKDGLWSGDILIQTNDQHGIIDMDTMEPINDHRRQITIGDHVWVGRRVIVMPDVTVAKGAILAAGAIVTTDVSSHSIFAGVPARLVRENATWSRAPRGLSADEKRMIERDMSD